MTTAIPERVAAFVREHFRTPAELDVFLHTFRRGEACTAEAVAIATGLRTTHARLTLDTLSTKGLLRCSEGAWSVTDEVRLLALELSAVYEHYRRRLVELVVQPEG